MRSIKSTKDPVPVGIVALSAKEQISGVGDFLRTARFGAAVRNSRQASAGAQHLFVKQVGLRIFAEKSTPRTTTQKSSDFGPLRKFLLHQMKALAYGCRQRPLHHFRIRSYGQLGAAKRSTRFRVFAGRSKRQPI